MSQKERGNALRTEEALDLATLPLLGDPQGDKLSLFPIRKILVQHTGLAGSFMSTEHLKAWFLRASVFGG